MRVSSFADDPHSERGSDCPRNRFGTTDYEKLSRTERIFSAQRVHELERQGISGSFNVAHLRKIHWYLFRDVYPWAGDLRLVEMSKSGGVAFGSPQFLLPALSETLGKLAAENLLAGLDKDVFVERAAYYLGEVNAIHAFREGNGRTQREFFRQLGLHCGFVLSWEGLGREENIVASVLSHTRGDNSGLMNILNAAIVGTGPKVNP